MAPPAQRPPSSNGMGHRGVHREEKEGEGGIHARSQASGKRPKRPRKREGKREEMSDLCVAVGGQAAWRRR